MTLPEPIEVINQRLLDYFGKFENGEANWKIVWSEEFTEKCLSKFTDNGIELLTPIVREVKKANYIKDRYVLTRLVPVPQVDSEALLGAKLSYEPIWTYETNSGNPTVPTWEMTFALITTLYQKMVSLEHSTSVKMPEEMMQTPEAISHRIDELQELLFGNETDLADSLGRDSAVGYGVRKRSDWLH